jgi:hypothetical protein
LLSTARQRPCKFRQGSSRLEGLLFTMSAGELLTAVTGDLRNQREPRAGGESLRPASGGPEGTLGPVDRPALGPPSSASDVKSGATAMRKSIKATTTEKHVNTSVIKIF